MQKVTLIIAITIQIPVPPMPPAPVSAEKPEPFLTKSRRRYAAAMCAMGKSRMISFPSWTTGNTGGRGGWCMSAATTIPATVLRWTMGYERAKKQFDPNDYRREYAYMPPKDMTLEEVFSRHNADTRPFGTPMRSMSVSDVLVVNRGGKNGKLRLPGSQTVFQAEIAEKERAG